MEKHQQDQRARYKVIVWCLKRLKSLKKQFEVSTKSNQDSHKYEWNCIADYVMWKISSDVSLANQLNKRVE
jgi:hypothetical protein